jgi:integrase/recombinase XerD
VDPENPAKLVTIPQIVSKDEDMMFLTVPEVELLVRFLAYTGVRINEVLALQIQDLDFRNRKARIRRTWSDDGEGRMQLGTQKTVRRGPSPCRSLSFPN